MDQEIQLIVDETRKGMESVVYFLKKEFGNIRAGRASPAMLASVMVEYYGTQTPLSQVASLSTPDAQTIVIQPWEKSLIIQIERGIVNANLGFNPMNNGDQVIINIPFMTEERRKELSKRAKLEAENAKVSARNTRRDSNHNIKKLEISDDEKKMAEEKIQSLTDSYIKKIDQIYEQKHVEIIKF